MDLAEEQNYIRKEKRWLNKQRTLIFCSRGVSHRFRHFMEDVKRLIPAHKSEAKFEKKQSLKEAVEIAELKNCNNCIYFETRKGRNLFVYFARTPSGPTFKFQVFNMHTLGETKLSGNCLHGSRPFLHFDAGFDSAPHFKLLKELFTQIWGMPRNHPKSKPFYDHVLGFYLVEGKVFLRHYQIQPTAAAEDAAALRNDPMRQTLVEIGPRAVLNPVHLLSGAFDGEVLWKNPEYITPTRASADKKLAEKERTMRRLHTKTLADDRREAALKSQPDELDEIFGF